MNKLSCIAERNGVYVDVCVCVSIYMCERTIVSNLILWNVYLPVHVTVPHCAAEMNNSDNKKTVICHLSNLRMRGQKKTRVQKNDAGHT